MDSDFEFLNWRDGPLWVSWAVLTAGIDDAGGGLVEFLVIGRQNVKSSLASDTESPDQRRR
jgi:hypothetical protein